MDTEKKPVAPKILSCGVVPVPDRVKPHRVPLQFASKDEADAWIHSPDGKDMIREILSGKK